MVKVVSNVKTAAAEIVAVLHKNKIPLALIPTVYENVEQLIQMHTVPCGRPVSFPEEKEDPRVVVPPTPWPGSSKECTLSFAGTGAHRHSFPNTWKPNPEDYVAKDPSSSSTLNDPENNNS